MVTVYEARSKGKEYCQTDGSEHYIRPVIEPLQLIINSSYAEGFCLGNIIKYAARYEQTRDLEDIKKAVDYAHIFCGIAKSEAKQIEDEANRRVLNQAKRRAMIMSDRPLEVGE